MWWFTTTVSGAPPVVLGRRVVTGKGPLGYASRTYFRSTSPSLLPSAPPSDSLPCPPFSLLPVLAPVGTDRIVVGGSSPGRTTLDLLVFFFLLGGPLGPSVLVPGNRLQLPSTRSRTVTRKTTPLL